MEINSEHQSHMLAELNQMREQVVDLVAHLDQPSLAEFCKYLAPNLLSSLEKTISMAKTTGPGAQQQQGNVMLGAESPRSGIPSPRSENSNTDFRKGVSKKRKTTTKWTSKVRVNEGAAGGHDDGYSWRKYGQKIILGAKYPRGYFRCTHRHTQSCLATKQVQRSDEDPQVFDITYHGDHTCLHRNKPATAASARSGQEPQQSSQQPQQLLLQSFRTDLKVKTEAVMSETLGDEDEASVLFSFGATAPDAMLDNAFCSPSTPDSCFIGAPTTPFFSPTTSESTYFSMSPCRVSSLDELHRLNSSESDAISAANSVSASPVIDPSFPQFEPLFFGDDFDLFDASALLP